MPESSSNGYYKKSTKPKHVLPLDGSVYMAIGILADDKTPDTAVEQMLQIAMLAKEKQLHVRVSTSVHGKHIKERLPTAEMPVPWEGFADEIGDYKTNSHSKLIAMRFQPNLSKLKPAIHAIVGHMIHNVLGRDLISPVRCLICWTPDGCESIRTRTSRTGSLGVAVALASWMNIPIFNLRNQEAYDRAVLYLNMYSQPFTEGEFHPDLVAFNRMKEL